MFWVYPLVLTRNEQVTGSSPVVGSLEIPSFGLGRVDFDSLPRHRFTGRLGMDWKMTQDGA